MLVSLSACTINCVTSKTNEVRARLLAEVQYGDEREKVESALYRVAGGFTFDKFKDRYSAIIRDPCGPGKLVDVMMYVTIDEAGRVSSVEVFPLYTFL